MNPCSICTLSFETPDNSLVTCGNCSVIVHEGCYGASKAPNNSNWFCRKCESQVRVSKIRCDLCPIKEGAFKRSNCQRFGWAHLLCSLYFHDVTFDGNLMDLVNLDGVSQDNFNRSCVFCERNQRNSQASCGACLQCSWKSCRSYFHATCASLSGLLVLPPSFLATSTTTIASILDRGVEDPCSSLKNIELPPHTEIAKSRTQLIGFCSKHHRKKYFDQSRRGRNSTRLVDDALSKCSDAWENDSVQGNGTATGARRSVGPRAPGQESPTLSTTSSRSSNVSPTRAPPANGRAPATKHAHSGPVTTEEACGAFKTKKARLMEALADQKEESDVTANPRVPILCGSPTKVPVAGTTPKPEHTAMPGLLFCQTEDPSPPVEVAVTRPARQQAAKSEPPIKASRPKKAKDADEKRKPRGRKNMVNGRGPLDATAGAPMETAGAQMPQSLRLVPPRRPLTIRSVGLDMAEATNGPLSPLSNGHTPATLPSTPQLATMHDLLEWQWDQAGALLMQQADGTDVVSLLDCLHQLKSENDSLDGKCLRLQQKRDHLKSVNSRLKASLSSIEATAANAVASAAAAAATPGSSAAPAVLQTAISQTPVVSAVAMPTSMAVSGMVQPMTMTLVATLPPGQSAPGVVQHALLAPSNARPLAPGPPQNANGAKKRASAPPVTPAPTALPLPVLQQAPATSPISAAIASAVAAATSRPSASTTAAAMTQNSSSVAVSTANSKHELMKAQQEILAQQSWYQKLASQAPSPDQNASDSATTTTTVANSTESVPLPASTICPQQRTANWVSSASAIAVSLPSNGHSMQELSARLSMAIAARQGQMEVGTNAASPPVSGVVSQKPKKAATREPAPKSKPAQRNQPILPNESGQQPPQQQQRPQSIPLAPAAASPVSTLPSLFPLAQQTHPAKQQIQPTRPMAVQPQALVSFATQNGAMYGQVGPQTSGMQAQAPRQNMLPLYGNGPVSTASSGAMVAQQPLQSVSQQQQPSVPVTFGGSGGGDQLPQTPTVAVTSSANSIYLPDMNSNVHPILSPNKTHAQTVGHLKTFVTQQWQTRTSENPLDSAGSSLLPTPDAQMEANAAIHALSTNSS